MIKIKSQILTALMPYLINKDIKDLIKKNFIKTSSSFNKNQIQFPLSEKAVEVNADMPRHTFEIAMKNLTITKSSNKVLILGILQIL